MWLRALECSCINFLLMINLKCSAKTLHAHDIEFIN